MKKPIALLTAITFLATTLTNSGQFAFAISVGSSTSTSGNISAQMGQIAESAGPVQAFQADLFTGRAQTSVPIFVPPGRKNIQPNLALSYSSSSGNGWLGMGWGLDLGYIQRDLKKGVPRYDSTDSFVFSFQGVNSELIEIDTNEYRAKDEALFLKVEYDPTNNKWTVTDKSGTQHIFGLTSAARQTNASGTFKWLLSKVVDTTGNYMSVSYTTDEGEVYLSSIEYNGNEDQSFEHTHKVDFTLEDRTDTSISYITGARVERNKRLQMIEVKVKNAQGAYQRARKYVLGYNYSASTKRSILVSVTEYGTDGTTNLPAVEFTYTTKPASFDSVTNWTNIENLGDNSWRNLSNGTTDGAYDTFTYVDILDLDGDGLPDRILKETRDATVMKWQRNDGDSFEDCATFSDIDNLGYANPFGAVRTVQSPQKVVNAFYDINSDGLPDRVMVQDGDGQMRWRVQLNDGEEFGDVTDWTNIEDDGLSSLRNIQYAYKDQSLDYFMQAYLTDMNGDGLPDRILKRHNSASAYNVQLNNGSSFEDGVNWDGIDSLGSETYYGYIQVVKSPYHMVQGMIDINGDGLVDRVMYVGGEDYFQVQFNTGSGFASVEDWGPVDDLNLQEYGHVIYSYTPSGSSSSFTRVDMLDINGDGLPDRVMKAAQNDEYYKVQINNGHGFENAVDWTGLDLNSDAATYGWIRAVMGDTNRLVTDLVDIDGDGLTDRVMSKDSDNYWKVQLATGEVPDMLTGIDNGRGGETTITYTPSTQFDNTDTNGKQRLPFPVQVVGEVVQEDGMGNSYTTNYSYKGGLYEGDDREFRGFKEVTVTDAVGTQTINYFHQDDQKKGRLWKKEVSGHTVNATTGILDLESEYELFSKEETTWSTSNPYTGVTFAYVSQQDNYVYDGDDTSKHTRQAFTYDSYGNLASTTEYGDYDVAGDERRTVNTYTYNTDDYLLNALSKTTLYDDDTGGNVKAERYFYYDGATSITTAPTDGLLTKEEEWLSTASGCGTPGVCANNPKTTMTYDSYGNVATVQDARSYTTTNTYETTWHLFLTQISNALSQTRQFTYDERLAQILTSTDQNGQVTKTEYDVLGRVTKVIAPLDSLAPAAETKPTQEFSYEYPNLGTCGTTCVTKTTTKVKTSIGDDTLTQLITYSFTDGLGREIQRRTPDEDSNKQIITGIVTFNNRGQIDKQYVPYLADTSTSYQAPDTSKPKATFYYDAVGRRTRIDYPDSTNSNVVFSDFVKTTTDQRGKQLRYTNDAYGRLGKVEEFNSGSTYTTTYEYDVLNNLKKTTDNASNETTVTYDSLSRKTAMTDPDMGSWSYTYDLNDNLASQTDAKSQAISFTYDALNRVTLKDLPAGETDVNYYYDSAPASYSGQTGYWVGRLAKVSDASGDHEFLYDKQGRVLKDKKTVDSNGYEFVRTYDSMGRVRTLTYPDTEVVTYTYNGMGDVETISGLKNSVTTDYIEDVDYNAAGQITFTKYGNDVTSDYTYNANTLRLSNILTKKPDGTTKLQDLAYTFDNNGNVTAIDDTVNSMSQDFTYDDLNRLTQAVGSAYGTQNFAYDSIGNMTTKDDFTMTYGAGAAGPHAVTEVTSAVRPTFCPPGSGSCTMGYDANGNMTTRGVDTLAYDSENRLKEMNVYEGIEDTHEYTLQPGWNVISFPYLPDNKSVTSVLSTLTFGTDYDQISYWDETTDTWKHFVNDSDFNDFTAFEHGKTYDIYVSNANGVTFSVTGKTPAVAMTHNLVSGDNFVSPSVTEATSISSLLSTLTLDTDYSDVKRYNATTDQWESWEGGAFTNFEPGKGYLIVGLQNASFEYGADTETTTTFVYDSTGSRVKKTTEGSTTIYLGKDYDIASSLTTKYIFLGDRQISIKKSDGTLQFIHDDHINSSNVVSDSSGNQVALYEFDPYGSTATHTGSADIKHQFTGQEKDDSTGLLFFGPGRYMDPQLGRFITADWFVQDPTDPQSFNRYAYARNNPIKFVDPTGNFWEIVVAIIVKAIIGAAIGAAVGAALGALDALVTGRPVGQSAVRGMIGGAIGGAIAGATFGTAEAFFGTATAKGIMAVVGLGLGTYSAVQNFRNGNYFSGGFSALVAFASAHELYSMSQSANSSGQAASSRSSNSSAGSELDSPENSLSGSGNPDVELKTRDVVRQTLKPTTEEPSFGGLLDKGKNWVVEFSQSKSQLTAAVDIFTGVPSVVRAYTTPGVGFWGKAVATAEFGFGLFGGRLVVTASRYYKFSRGANAAGNFARWARNINTGNRIEKYGGYAVKGHQAKGVYDAERYALN